jgi:hypothetical protein
VIIAARQHILSSMNVKGFKKCCISHAANGTALLWNQSEKVGNVGTSVKKVKALSVKMNT